MSPYLALYLGGVVANVFGSGLSVPLRTVRSALLLVFFSTLWPVTVFLPLVLHFATRRGWFGMAEVLCPGCGSPGIARYRPEAVAPPSGWFVVVAGPEECKLVLLTCSERCAAVVRENLE